ncbi:MAG: cytidine deaminase [Candidatus Fermentibacteraceae bacterium]
MDDTGDLIERAKALIPMCHCPYSGFRVTAVLEDRSGELHHGVNIENSSLGLSICAERVALDSAVSRGVRGFRRILVYSPDGLPMPCGACRQVLAEFCGPDLAVIVTRTGETPKSFILGDLLPHAFILNRQM